MTTPSPFRRFWDSAGMLVVLVALYAACAALVPGFFSWVNT